MKRIILFILFMLLSVTIHSDSRIEKQFTLYVTDRTYYNKDKQIIGMYHKSIDVNDNIFSFLHEYGHYISHLLVGDDKSKKEFNDIIELYKDKYKNRRSRFDLDYSTRELKDYRKSMIQDIVNAFTRGKVWYIYKHPTEYWNDYNIYQEVFANLYVLYVVGDQKQINELNKIFPGLMASYVNMINSNRLKLRK